MTITIKMIETEPNIEKAIGVVDGLMALLWAQNPGAEEVTMDLDDPVIQSAVNTLVTLMELTPNLDQLIPDDEPMTRHMLEGIKFYMAIGRNIG